MSTTLSSLLARDATDSAALCSSQRLLVTLVGDYWLGEVEPIPSAALVALLADFGVSETGARAALSRVGRGGRLERTRSGRSTSYRLAPTSVEWARDNWRTLARYTSRGLDPTSATPWDGTWTCVAYSLPEDQRDTRPVVRSRLRRLGFAPLYDGVWVCPYRRGGPAETALRELGVSAFTVFASADPSAGSGLLPLDAFDLAPLRAHFERLAARFGHAAERMRSGSMGPAESLVVRTDLMDRWRQMPDHDPALPRELLPASWPGWAARRLFADVYDGLGELAAERVRQIVRVHSPEVAARVEHRSIRGLGMLRGRPGA